MTGRSCTAPGRCRSCGHRTDHGRVVMNAERASGPGFQVVVCPACDLAPEPAAVVETARGYCTGCGDYVANGVVAGHVEQGSGAGLTPVECPACIAVRRRVAARRDAKLRRTEPPRRERAS